MSITHDTFTLYPSHIGFIPGETPLEFKAVGPTGVDAIASLVIGVMLGIVSVLMLLAFYNIGILPHLFATQGVETTGQVIACEMVRSKSYGSIPELTYTYTWNGTSFQGTVKISERNLACGSDFNRMAVVQLLPFDPQQSRLVLINYDPNQGNIFLAVAVLCFGLWMGLMALAAVVMSFAHLRARRVYPRLMSEGQLLRGEIADISGTTSGKSKNFIVTISYHFQSPLGEVLKGRASHHRQDLQGTTLPPVGTLVNILYVDNKTFVML